MNELNIPMEDGTVLIKVCPQESGVYLLFKVPAVTRGIRGKDKGKVDELLIIGVPWSKANRVLAKYGIRIDMKDYELL